MIVGKRMTSHMFQIIGPQFMELFVKDRGYRLVGEDLPRVEALIMVVYPRNR